LNSSFGQSHGLEIYGTEMMEMQFNPEIFNNITPYEEIGNYGYE
jgi:hypothetical protein